MSKNLNIGILGLGTVGTGVVKCLQKNGGLIAARSGVEITIKHIADLDIERDRGLKVDPAILTSDAESVINDPDVKVIVELIGGTTVARRLVLKALGAGKSVVTANKALLAKHGDEIFAAAEATGADIFYEASVAGGIPIIKSLREGLCANHIIKIFGIFNGTCNYILTRMEQADLPFDVALKEAQDLGFAEADPALDIDGGDTAHKTCILGSLAYGTWFELDEMHVEGIRGLDLLDLDMATKLGFKLKLLGIIKAVDGHAQMRVHPTLVPADSMLAKVDDAYNAVFVEGDVVGRTMFYGPGAGQDPTASAVVSDIVDIGLNMKHDVSHRVTAFKPHGSYRDSLVSIDDITCRYYLRFNVIDEPGILAKLTGIFGELGISISNINQEASNLIEGDCTVIFLTHIAREGTIKEALRKIADQQLTHGSSILLRIEDV